MSDIKKTRMPEQDDALAGQSVTKESAYPENIISRSYEIEDAYRERYYDLTDGDVKVDKNTFGKTIERIAQQWGKRSEEVRNEIEN